MHSQYLEIYNPSGNIIALSGYGYPSVSNAPTEAGVHEYWNAFDVGATIAPFGVYIVCHGSADASILVLCNEQHSYLSNGDDGYCLAKGTEANHTFVDCIGDFHGDPGSGWDVCGVSSATKDRTLVRKSSVTTGNSGDWAASAGTTVDDCEWLVNPKNDWSALGTHSVDGDSSTAGSPAPSLPPSPAAPPALSLTLFQVNNHTDSSAASGSSCYHSRYTGALVVVTGYVTGVSYDGFYMQDKPTSALYEGVWVYAGSNDPILLNRSAGERVQVTAIVEEYYGLTELSLTKTPLARVTQLSMGTAIEPLVTTTGAIGTGCNAGGEAHEG